MNSSHQLALTLNQTMLHTNGRPRPHRISIDWVTRRIRMTRTTHGTATQRNSSNLYSSSIGCTRIALHLICNRRDFYCSLFNCYIRKNKLPFYLSHTLWALFDPISTSKSNKTLDSIIFLSFSFLFLVNITFRIYLSLFISIRFDIKLMFNPTDFIGWARDQSHILRILISKFVSS